MFKLDWIPLGAWEDQPKDEEGEQKPLVFAWKSLLVGC